MSKRYCKIWGAILAAAMLLGPFTLVTANNSPEVQKADPFASMYDSDVIFEENVESVLEQIEKNRQVEGVISEEFSFDDALSYVEAENVPAGLAPLATDSELKMVEAVYEMSRVDRFIVKYKSGALRQFPRSVDLRIEAESIESVANTTNMDGNIEVITLDEKVNPAEFAESLRNAGYGDIIEYIQPDFLMSYASLDLSYEIENEGSLESDEEPTAEPTDEEIPVDEDIPEPEETALPDVTATEPLPTIEIPSPTPTFMVSEIIIALIDTGVDTGHPMLADSLLAGWDFADGDDDIYNETNPVGSSHGTHIAGIIAGNSTDSVKILPLKVFGDSGAYTSDILAAISYAEVQGAKICNMSFGSGSYNPALYEAMQNSEMLFVTAAGNYRSDLASSPIYPAAYDLPNIIRVTSLNPDGGFSYYSNFSSSLIDIAAPGRDVVSALPGGETGPQSGTSMSAGFVSAAAGDVLSADVLLAAEEVKDRLVESGDMLQHLMNKVKDGRMLNAEMAVLGEVQTVVQTIDCEDDFDIFTPMLTPQENWELLSAKEIKQVSAGDGFILCLATDGTVWSWGRNNNGYLGNGTTTASATPVQVYGLTNVTYIAAGVEHCLAVKADGTAWVWGANLYGEFGNGTTTLSSVPLQVTGITNAKSGAAGYGVTIILKTDGTLSSSGYNGAGQLGIGNIQNKTTMQSIPDFSNVKQVSMINTTVLAVKDDGTAWAWGHNYYGQVGSGTWDAHRSPVKVASLSGVKSVYAAASHSLFLLENGDVYTCGRNEVGQLADGTLVNRNAPVKISSLSGVKEIAGGLGFSMVLKNDGTVWACGWGTSGQLGDGAFTSRDYFVQVSGLTGVTNIVSGWSIGLAVKPDGSLWGWGLNYYDLLKVPGPGSYSAPVRVHENLLTIVQSGSGSTELSSELTINAVSSARLNVFIGATCLTEVSDLEIVFEYDPLIFELLDACAFTPENETTTGEIPRADLEITLIQPGRIVFLVNKNIPDGYTFSGVITAVKLRAISTGQSTVHLG